MNFISLIREELGNLKQKDEGRKYIAHVVLTCGRSGVVLDGHDELDKPRTYSGYHMEFGFGNADEAGNFAVVLAEYDMFPKVIGDVVYLKSGECICNLLALVGAKRSLLMLHNEIALRDVRNRANRQANCELANIGKQVEASKAQIERLTALIEEGKLDGLSDKLRNTAIARVQYPEMTYSELAKLLCLTKSGLVNRLRTLLCIT